MSQSKRMSFIEACTNTAVGLVLAFATNAILMYLTGVMATATQNALIVGGHTVVSVIRQYVLRRYFNRKDATTAHTVRKAEHSGCSSCRHREQFERECG